MRLYLFRGFPLRLRLATLLRDERIEDIAA